MGLFGKRGKSSNEVLENSKNANLQSMIFTTSHICDSFIKNKCNGYVLTNEDWKTIWSCFYFSGTRFMTSEKAIRFTNSFIGESRVDQTIKSLNTIVSLKPDERFLYQLTEQHQEFLNAVNKQIYEIAFEPLLNDSSLADRQLIYNEILPMVEHYSFLRLPSIRDAHHAFAEIAASSLSLAAEEIVLQTPIYGIEKTKSRYGAAQVYFSFAMFLHMQTA